MSEAQQPRSEVATLLAQIQQEYEAAERGLHGLALGTSQHEFITKKMERVGALHQDLHALVGEQAIAMVAETLEHCLPAQECVASPDAQETMPDIRGDASSHE